MNGFPAYYIFLTAAITGEMHSCLPGVLKTGSQIKEVVYDV